MPALMSVTKASTFKTGFKTQAAPAVLKRHALRCRPVAFKEEDKLENKVADTLKDAKNALGRQPGFDESAPKVNPAIPVFTRRREVFASRLAMVGFFAACFWEANLSSHPGVIGQVSQFTGIPPFWVGIILAGTIAYNTFGALIPGSPTYSSANLNDVSKRPPAGPQNPADVGGIKDWLGVDSWGFTKKNEIFNGRLAMLGILAAVIQEWRLGGLGPLAQIAYFLNITPTDGFFSLANKSLIVFTILATSLAFLDGNINGADDEKDVY